MQNEIGKTRRSGKIIGFAHMAERLVKEHTFSLQGELSTRKYDRPIQIPNGKETIEHSQFVVEVRADTICILDRSSNGEQSDAAELPADDCQNELA